MHALALVIALVIALVLVHAIAVVVGLQHSYATISCQLPTLGLFLRNTRLPDTTLPDPSNLTKAFNGRLLMLPIFLSLKG